MKFSKQEGKVTYNLKKGDKVKIEGYGALFIWKITPKWMGGSAARVFLARSMDAQDWEVYVHGDYFARYIKEVL